MSRPKGGEWRSRALGRVWMDLPSFVWRNWDEGDQGIKPYVVFWDVIWLFGKAHRRCLVSGGAAAMAFRAACSAIEIQENTRSYV